MNNDRLDILCFGAHPDDVEIGMAGTIRKHVDLGFKVGICDLTMAELSSNGTVTQRQKEAEQAAEILGVTERINLGFPDRGLEANRDVLGKVVSVIRKYQPKVVFLPFEEDRHPDHGMTTKLVEEAIFTATIRKYQWSSEEEEQAHKVTQVYYYFINGMSKPHLMVDITPYMEDKRKSLLAYESQFDAGANRVTTRLNQGFIEVVEGRERWFGKMIDVSYAEGFKVKEPILISNLIPDSDNGSNL
jgi:bacillithiol biosynthesis deacetylase BshB1